MIKDLTGKRFGRLIAVREDEGSMWSKIKKSPHTWLAINLAMAALNIALAMFLSGWGSWANWIVAGFCLGVALVMPTVDRQRRLIEDMLRQRRPDVDLDALQHAMQEIIDDMKRTGQIPEHIKITVGREDGPPKVLH